jgi:hypothetical protein
MALPAYSMGIEIEKQIAQIEGKIEALVQEIKEINKKLAEHGIE